MVKKTLKKRCERCELQFDVPLLKKNSKTFYVAIKYTPCPHCYFVPDVKNPIFNKSGRCRRCSLPFAKVDHKAKGYCHRCLMQIYREQHSTK